MDDEEGNGADERGMETEREEEGAKEGRPARRGVLLLILFPLVGAIILSWLVFLLLLTMRMLLSLLMLLLLLLRQVAEVADTGESTVGVGAALTRMNGSDTDDDGGAVVVA